MTIRITGKNLDIGEALRGQVEARVQAAIAKYADGNGSGQVTVSRDGTGFRTDCVVTLPTGVMLEASGSAGDAYSSLDQSAIRIEKRMRRYKRRIKDRLGEPRNGGGGPQSSYAILEAPVVGDDDADEEEASGEFHPIVIAETTKRLDRMSVGEAVVELDLTGSAAVVFRHAGNGRVNVVYRRNDGTIGWVDPPTDGT